MDRRLTILFGAGASLDIVSDINKNYKENHDLTVAGLTDLVFKKESIFSKSDDRVINFLFKCKRFLDSRFQKKTNFEILYQLVVDLRSSLENNKTILDYDTSYFKNQYDVKLCNYSLMHILSIIHNEIRSLRGAADIEWVKQFLEKISVDFQYKDLFTLNYDDFIDVIYDDSNDGFTIEGSMKIGNVGKYYGFDVKEAMIFEGRNILNHLHGSIHFLNGIPEGETLSGPIIKYAVPGTTIYGSLTELQDGRLSLFSSIITGLDKVNSQIHMPYSAYHANLIRSIATNNRMLIIGYGFGDHYINSVIQTFIGTDGNRALYISPSEPNKRLTGDMYGKDLLKTKDERFWWYKGTFKQASAYE